MNSNYWKKVYESKNEDEVSWFQSEPKKSLELIDELQLAQDARVIDIGGGDSKLTDFLLNRGFSDISVLCLKDTHVTPWGSTSRFCLLRL